MEGDAAEVCPHGIVNRPGALCAECRRNDLGPLPKEHPREAACQRAKTELIGLLVQWQEKHNLTEAEEIGLLADQIALLSGFTVRRERKKA